MPENSYTVTLQGELHLNRQLIAAALILLATSVPATLPAAPSSSAKASSSHRVAHSGASKTSKGKKRHSRKPRGQQAIDPDRVSQIQAALVKAHYLKLEPNGQWDSTTVAAMQKYQADNNWQTKLMPDSRALIKLGLGPDYSKAVNANGSNFVSSAAQPPAEPETPLTDGFVQASGIRQ